MSKDRQYPRWKPLNMAGEFNSKKRRLAKMRSKGNWFKGRQEVDTPSRNVDNTTTEEAHEVKLGDKSLKKQRIVTVLN